MVDGEPEPFGDLVGVDGEFVVGVDHGPDGHVAAGEEAGEAADQLGPPTLDPGDSLAAGEVLVRDVHDQRGTPAGSACAPRG